MNTKKQVISSIIGGIIGSLITAVLVSSGTAQRDTFAKIRCAELEVVDMLGDAQVLLSAGDHGGVVTVYGKKDRKSGALLHAGEQGGRVSVYGEQGVLQGGLGAGKHGGLLVLMDEDGESKVLGKGRKGDEDE